jgi:DNA-binding PadR family transcriptional regulator
MATNSELAILSLLAEEPRHGYDIEQMIEQRGMRNWTEIGFSSIYYLLNKLERAGTIRSRVEPSRGKGPARKVYELTEAGRADWQQAVMAALSQPEPCHLPIQIGLSNLPLIPMDEARTALNFYLKNLQNRQNELADRQKNHGVPLPYQVNAMFGLSLAMIEAELNWIQSLMDELDALPE